MQVPHTAGVLLRAAGFLVKRRLDVQHIMHRLVCFHPAGTARRHVAFAATRQRLPLHLLAQPDDAIAADDRQRFLALGCEARPRRQDHAQHLVCVAGKVQVIGDASAVGLEPGLLGNTYMVELGRRGVSDCHGITAKA
jgi:hypothetical protein